MAMTRRELAKGAAADHLTELCADFKRALGLTVGGDAAGALPVLVEIDRHRADLAEASRLPRDVLLGDGLGGQR